MTKYLFSYCLLRGVFFFLINRLFRDVQIFLKFWPKPLQTNVLGWKTSKLTEIFCSKVRFWPPQVLVNYHCFSKFETLDPHNSGLLWPRKMFNTILEPAHDALQNGILHYGKIFALWATGVNTRFWRLVKYPKSASSNFFQILNWRLYFEQYFLSSFLSN